MAVQQALWQPNRDFISIDGVYLNQTNNDVLVSSSNGYAFLFEGYPQLSAILTERTQFIYKPFFADFAVDSSANISGVLSLQVWQENLTEEEKSLLLAKGFNNKERFFSYSVKLKGKLYTLESDVPFEKLRQEYSVSVNRPNTFSEALGKVLITPAAIVFDAMVTVPATFIVTTLMMADAVTRETEVD